ncbi:MAG: 2'-5' RNA ligase family protein, partial [Halovenus sp.]
MYSLNVPVPGQVGALAVEIARQLPSARARTRGEHTLGVKRLGSDAGQYSRIEAQAREALAGQPAFEAR